MSMRFFTKPMAQIMGRMPLRVVLVLPFLAQLAATVGLVILLSFYNSQTAIAELTSRLQSEVAARVTQRLEAFVSTPRSINQSNSQLIALGLLDVNDPAALEQYFWRQVQSFDTVTSIYFGNTRGGLALGGREGAGGALYIMETEGFAKGELRKYATGPQGQWLDQLASVPGFDVRVRPWYTGVVERGGDAWSSIYVLSTQQDLAIAYSRPVYGVNGQLQGVLSMDIFLSHLRDYLQKLPVGKTGQVFIAERSGLLVASSADQRLFVEEANGAKRRRGAVESSAPLVRAAASYLNTRFGDWNTIAGLQNLRFKAEGQSVFLEVTPFGAAYGLDWLIVTIIPEADFMEQIYANTRLALGLSVGALLLAIVTGVLSARWVTRPVLALNRAAGRLAQGDWQRPIPINRTDELGELAQAFNAMAGQLQTQFDGLQANNRELEAVNQALSQEIAWRKQTEAERNRLIAILDSTTDLVSMARLDGSLIYLNRAGRRLLGWDSDESLAGKQIAQAHTPAVFEIIQRQGIPDAIRNGVWEGETILCQHDGGQIATSQVIMAHRSPDGELECISTIMRDISARKQMEQAIKASESRYRELFEGTYNGVAVYEAWQDGQDFIFLDFNRAGEQIEQMSRQAVIGRKVSEVFPGVKDLGLFEVLQRVWRSGQPEQHPVSFYQDQRIIGWRENYVYKLPSGELVAVYEDATARKLAEDEVQLLAATVEESTVGIGISDLAGQLVYVNRALLNLYGYGRDELIGQSVFDLNADPADTQTIRANMLNTGRWVGEVRQRRKDSRVYTAWISLFTVEDKSGQPRSMVVFVNDITEQALAAQALRESEEKYRLFLQNFQGIAYQAVLGSYEPVFFHGTVEDITGYTAQDFIGGSISWDQLIDPLDQALVAEESKKLAPTAISSYVANTEYRIRRKDGELRWINDIARACEVWGQPPVIQGALYDITARKQAEGRLKAALAEKEALLKEIHHRVKNNLQVIVSLLNLQAARVQDEHVLAILKDSQSRVRSMALIHENLYRSSTLARIDFGSYLRQLTRHLAQAYIASAAAIRLHVDVQDIFLDLDTATTCGLLVNELVSNCFKHAFPDGRSGDVWVKMDAEAGGQFTLEVSDNGVGLQPDLDWQKTGSLGLQLVNMLASHNLQGAIALDSNAGGARFSVTFHLSEDSGDRPVEDGNRA